MLLRCYVLIKVHGLEDDGRGIILSTATGAPRIVSQELVVAELTNLMKKHEYRVMGL